MSDSRSAIKDAIERQVGNGDWNGITVDNGRYEANIDTLDIDLESIEFEGIYLEEGNIIVTASGTGTATHKDADGNEVCEEYDISVTSKINIGVSGAEIVGVTNAG